MSIFIFLKHKDTTKLKTLFVLAIIAAVASLVVGGIVNIVLFVLIYLVLFIAWARIVARFIKQGPTQEQPAPVAASSNSFMSGTPPVKAADASANDETAPAATKEGE